MPGKGGPPPGVGLETYSHVPVIHFDISLVGVLEKFVKFNRYCGKMINKV